MWRCVKNCGACCHLDPEARPDLAEYLSEAELAQYLSMVGEDGWCINFDRQNRTCTIYETRPRFCRVEADVFKDMYGIEPEELDEFAIDCCEQQIADVYGEDSSEWQKFAAAVDLA
jgi:Fe-S-cluster containining protein